MTNERIQELLQEIDVIETERKLNEKKLEEIKAEQEAIREQINAIGMYDSSRTDETLHELLRRQNAVDRQMIAITWQCNKAKNRLVEMFIEIAKAA